MIPYLLLFAFPAFKALRASQQLGWVLLLPIALMVGLRHEVGADWLAYADIFERYSTGNLTSWLQDGEPGYALLNGLSGYLGWGEYGVNLFCALIFSVGLLRFCQAQPLPALALTVAVPYLVMVVAMGYTRQGVAIGLGMMALLALERQHWFRFAAWVLLAATFHKTAVLLFSLALLMTGGGWWWRFPLMAAVALFAYQSILSDSIDGYILNYEQAGYQSQGAAIRVAMNALPAILFLKYRRQFNLSPSADKLWGLMAYGALLMVVALVVANSSTAVDRIALYLIPLQLFVWSRMPARGGMFQKDWNRYVVLYSFSVMMVWLFFAGHSSAWLPYQFYPWVWLF